MQQIRSLRLGNMVVGLAALLASLVPGTACRHTVTASLVEAAGFSGQDRRLYKAAAHRLVENDGAGDEAGDEADDEQAEDGSEHGFVLNGEWCACLGRQVRDATNGRLGVAACRSIESSHSDRSPVSVVAPIFGVRHGRRRRTA